MISRQSLSIEKSHPFPPGPRARHLLGELPALMKDPLGAFTQLVADHGDFVYFKKGFNYRYLLTNPEGVLRVLVENQNNYKKSPRYQSLSLVLGNGLLTTDGQDWIRQRKMCQSFFRPKALEVFENIIDEEIEKKIEIWRQGSINLFAEMTSLTLAIAARSFFGYTQDLNGELDSQLSNPGGIPKSIDLALYDVNLMMESAFQFPSWVPSIRKRRLSRNVEVLNQFVRGLIDQKRKYEAKDSMRDMLSMMIKADLTPQEIRDQVMTFLVTGHETTATCLTWTLYALVNNPQFLEESQRRGPLSEEFLDALINESLRLYPPVWIFSRVAINEDFILGYPIAKGATLNISPYLTHRHPGYWENPNQFDPTRFLQNKSQHKGAFLPFALGARQCIGAQFAIMVVKMCLKRMLKEFVMELDSLSTDVPVKLNPGVVLRPGNDIWIKLKLMN